MGGIHSEESSIISNRIYNGAAEGIYLAHSSKA